MHMARRVAAWVAWAAWTCKPAGASGPPRALTGYGLKESGLSGSLFFFWLLQSARRDAPIAALELAAIDAVDDAVDSVEQRSAPANHAELLHDADGCGMRRSGRSPDGAHGGQCESMGQGAAGGVHASQELDIAGLRRPQSKSVCNPLSRGQAGGCRRIQPLPSGSWKVV